MVTLAIWAVRLTVMLPGALFALLSSGERQRR
jgi:hypothetical protein